MSKKYTVILPIKVTIWIDKAPHNPKTIWHNIWEAIKEFGMGHSSSLGYSVEASMSGLLLGDLKEAVEKSEAVLNRGA